MLDTWEQGLRFQLEQHSIRPFFVIAHIPSKTELDTLEAEFTESSRRVALAAWRTPERNLDYPAIIFSNLIFGSRLRIFRQQGGIEGILLRTQRRVESRIPLLYGAATLAICAPLPSPQHSNT